MYISSTLVLIAIGVRLRPRELGGQNTVYLKRWGEFCRGSQAGLHSPYALMASFDQPETSAAPSVIRSKPRCHRRKLVQNLGKACLAPRSVGFARCKGGEEAVSLVQLAQVINVENIQRKSCTLLCRYLSPNGRHSQNPWIYM